MDIPPCTPTAAPPVISPSTWSLWMTPPSFGSSFVGRSLITGGKLTLNRSDGICVSLQSQVQCQMSYCVIPAAIPPTPRHTVFNWRIHVLWTKVSVSMIKWSWTCVGTYSRTLCALKRRSVFLFFLLLQKTRVSSRAVYPQISAPCLYWSCD